jgi:hypothetical protein
MLPVSHSDSSGSHSGTSLLRVAIGISITLKSLVLWATYLK